ncbi:MAG TPA: hypothetical protein VIX42_11055 [Edaphobacter sp.]
MPIITSVLLATVAFFSVFSNSGLTNELLIDTIGIGSFTLAVLAAVLLYPLRSEIRFRLLCILAILIAVVVGFEFLGGFLWFLSDKFVRYEQKG